MKSLRSLAAAALCLFVCTSVFAQKIAFQGKVVEVIDGSTVVVETPTPTRFVVKCPSSTAPQVSEPSGEQSRQRLSDLLMSRTVLVEYIKPAENGRIVGTILLNGDDVCLEQVRSGLVWFDRERELELSASMRDVYRAGEARARHSQLGLWATSQVTATDVGTSGTSRSRTLPEQAQSTTSASGPEVDVKGYFKKDGTYVQPHKRTAPDKRVDDNWSTIGNTNPYTGKRGTKNWFARNWWIFPTVGAVIGTSYWLSKSQGNNGGLGIICNDGTVSPAQNRQGACSHHGGIRR